MSIRKILKEVFEATINNKPLAGEPHPIEDPSDMSFDSVVEVDTELKVGILEKTSVTFFYFIFTDAYDNESVERIVGSMDVRHVDDSPYPVIHLIRVHPKFQGKGIGKTIYEWLISRYGGIVSDSSLTKQGGKGSYHIWRSLEDSGYKISVVRWSDVEDAHFWNPRKVKSIKNWVKIGKGAFRLVAEAR